MPCLQPGDLFQAEYLMHHTGTVPEYHVTASYFVDVSTQVFIRSKNDLLVFWKTFNDYFGITAGNDHITQSLDTRTAVDIADYHMIRMLFFELFNKRRRATIAQGRTRLQIRDHNLFSGVEDLGCFSHEMHTRKNDHVCTGLFGLLSQAQTIADIVGYILDIRFLVVMRQQNSILFLFEPFNLGEKVKRWI